MSLIFDTFIDRLLLDKFLFELPVDFRWVDGWILHMNDL